ncbi:MAG: indolepyruvate oxidoreductase subunit beta [Magnetococcales bacterium]|nr:indolepyruvate oxidoreductase subunit beta [Magnetococcales bacterium]
MDDTITNLLVVGIGGLGVMTAAEILAEAAISLGYDVKKTEVAGMAQRGGVVSSHVRFGKKVLSPVITKGTADFLIGFEAAESLRWTPYLRPGGLALVNDMKVVPPVVSVGLYDYPDNPVEEIRQMGVNVTAFDAGAVAQELGNAKLVNTVMLGAVADQLPFSADALKSCILDRFRTRKPKLVTLNDTAFETGRRIAAENRGSEQ